jgi:diguanylate cyclase (GGDEF)-like protein/PAS domain S-box-containing protein
MRLTDFIQTDIEKILKQWDAFALTIRVGQDWNKSNARDDAREMLLVIAKDLTDPQTDREQSDKSKGLAYHSNETAADAHGISREVSGFSINDTISEFRALRASVIRLWTKANAATQPGDLEDITRFNEAVDQALSESMFSYATKKEKQTRLFETILSVSPDQLYILDLDGKFMFVNRATADLFGMSVDAIIGKTYFDLNFPFAADLQQDVRQVIEANRIIHGEFAHAFGSVTSRRFEYILAPVIGENKKVESIVVISRDVTERKAAEEETWHNANFDLLTGLPNRRLFNNRLEQDVKHSQRSGMPFGLLFIDLDRFKDVNDSLGHDAGDILLKQAAERINSCVRSTDTVARLGGDEFTVILNETNERNYLEVVAKKIIDVLEKPFQIYESVAHISGSIGVSRFPEDGATSAILVKNADHAMYMAKSSGRNQVSFFTPTANS